MYTLFPEIWKPWVKGNNELDVDQTINLNYT